jgi:quercetin 2,3-dioxygenase
MEKNRKIKKLIKSKPTLEGAGVHLKRAFGFSEVHEFDPFLLLDDFRSSNPAYFIKGFPWHPHRGIETITYVLKGKVEHADSMGNKGEIDSGDVQWMTAGSGIIHQEMPKGDDKGNMEGFQLWANLPASHKMMEPRYRDIKAKQIPEITTLQGVKIKIICGLVDGTNGPVHDIITRPEYYDITVPPDTVYFHPTIKGNTVIAYVISGKGLFCEQMNPFTYEEEGINYFDLNRDKFITNESLLLFDDGEKIEIKTEKESVRFLLLSGKPIGEPIAWYGPIVMNTQEELKIAFEEYSNGNFLKHNS